MSKLGVNPFKYDSNREQNEKTEKKIKRTTFSSQF